MKGYFIFVSIVSSLLLYGISCSSNDLCNDENSEYECRIVSGPKTYYSISPDSLKFQTFDCQFSHSIDDDYVSNYKWFLNDQIIGDVDTDVETLNKFNINFNMLHKRSTLKVDISRLGIGEYKVSCKFPNYRNPQRPIEERSATLFALGESELFEDEESYSSGEPIGVIFTKIISWNMDYTNATCKTENRDELKSNVEEIFRNKTFYQFFIFERPGCTPPASLRSASSFASFTVTIKAKVVQMKRDLNFTEFKGEIPDIAKKISEITVDNKSADNRVDIEKTLNASLTEVIKLKENSCSVIEKPCNTDYEKCTEGMNYINCTNLCDLPNPKCSSDKNQVCYIENKKAECGCIKSYVKFGSKCVKPALFYGVLGGCLGAIILILIIVIVVICLRRKKKAPETIRRYENIEGTENTAREEADNEPRTEEATTSATSAAAQVREREMKKKEKTKESRTEEVPRNKRYDDFSGDNEDDKKRKETPIMYPIVPIPLDERRDYDEVDRRGRGRRRDSLERVYTGEPVSRFREDYNQGQTNKGYAADKRKDDDADSWIGLEEYTSSRQAGLARPQLRPRYDSSPKSLERRPMSSESGRNMSRQKYSRDWNN